MSGQQSCLTSRIFMSSVERQSDPAGHRPARRRRRGARHHGAERLRQEHARARRSRAIREYEVTAGEVLFEGRDLLEMDPDERAREGVFMAFQYPVEIPGVNNAYFLKAALNAKRKHRGEPELDAMEFMALIKEKAKLLEIDQSMLSRAVNEGFSGGEKKRNEIFQMAVLEPKLAILDETDSGLDIDALQDRRRGRERDAVARARDHRRHALPAPARLHRARLRARAERRPDRQVRRQGAGARARAARAMAGSRPARSRSARRQDGHDASDRQASTVAGRSGGEAAGRAALAAGPPRARRVPIRRCSASRPLAKRSGDSRASSPIVVARLPCRRRRAV